MQNSNILARCIMSKNIVVLCYIESIQDNRESLRMGSDDKSDGVIGCPGPPLD